MQEKPVAEKVKSVRSLMLTEEQLTVPAVTSEAKKLFEMDDDVVVIDAMARLVTDDAGTRGIQYIMLYFLLSLTSPSNVSPETPYLYPHEGVTNFKV